MQPNHGAPSRIVDVVIVQGGPAQADVKANVECMVEQAEVALQDEPADFVVFSELATTPYFCVVARPHYFDWAESIPGVTTDRLGRLASKYRVNIIASLFERGGVRGTYYDSAVILDRDGRIVPGCLPDGTQVTCYRKCHISAHFDYEPSINEKYYFRGGPGFPVFEVDGLRVGCLICYDRSFPEAWRVLALHGTQIVFVLVASYARRRSDQFLAELRTAALQSGLFVVAANKGGLEKFEGREMHFFGSSCALDPMGELLVQGPVGEGPALVRVSLDLDRLERAARAYHYMRDRRPELYASIADLSLMERVLPR